MQKLLNKLLMPLGSTCGTMLVVVPYNLIGYSVALLHEFLGPEWDYFEKNRAFRHKDNGQHLILASWDNAIRHTEGRAVASIALVRSPKYDHREIKKTNYCMALCRNTSLYNINEVF